MKSSIVNKRQSRAFRVLLILLIFALGLSGCGQKAALEKGFGYTFTPNSAMLAIRSDTDIFQKDDVTFDLYYGTYNAESAKKYNQDPRGAYAASAFADSKLIFALYICDADVQKITECADYKEIDNHYFVREMSEEEALSEEYSFTMSYWKDVIFGEGITYNHSEEITIPAELFTEDSGRLSICLAAFHEPVNDGDNYHPTITYRIDFSYRVIDGTTVKISKR
ncbi:MAG: lipoprotein [Oscillospiraceae bacterium]|nr:lipoprotein [Oscillospiraceae bacterium]